MNFGTCPRDKSVCLTCVCAIAERNASDIASARAGGVPCGAKMTRFVETAPEMDSKAESADFANLVFGGYFWANDVYVGSLWSRLYSAASVDSGPDNIKGVIGPP